MAQGNAANEVNPFRYRGYYYDSELELYYLQSRYYYECAGVILIAIYAPYVLPALLPASLPAFAGV